MVIIATIIISAIVILLSFVIGVCFGLGLLGRQLYREHETPEEKVKFKPEPLKEEENND